MSCDQDEVDFEQASRQPGRQQVKPKRQTVNSKAETFVKVHWWFAVQAAAATHTKKALVFMWLLHLSWKAHHATFVVPNGGLVKSGVSHQTKLRALRELEAAGLIEVQWRHRKSPIVTLRYPS
jgi:hypothetical protein